MTPVIVTWLDSVDYGDGEGEPKHKATKQVAIGWLLKYDDDGISYCGEYSPYDNTWRNETFIRGEDILKVEELYEWNRRKFQAVKMNQNKKKQR